MMFQSSKHVIEGELFGIFTHPRDAEVVFIPVPWEVTSPGDSGAAFAPESILKSSWQINLFRPWHPKGHQIKFAILPVPYDVKVISEQLHEKVEKMVALNAHRTRPVKNVQEVKIINKKLFQLKEQVKAKVLKYLDKGKIVGLVGGESTSALGCVEALTKHYSNFGILHLGAEAGLQETYQGLYYAYTSTMYRIAQLKEVSKLVQVGLRSYREEEYRYVEQSAGRIVPFFDRDMKRKLFEGGTWQEIMNEVIASLPDRIYIRFDINGLDVRYCPNTGNPAPGGLEITQVNYLIEQLVEAGKTILAFDLCNIGGNESADWDALVGGHLLYHLGLHTTLSQGRA